MDVGQDDIRLALRQVLPALLDGLPEVLDHVGDLLRNSWPDYASFLEGQHDEVVQTGRLALGRIVAMAERSLDDPHPPAMEDAESGLVLFEEIGRTQFRLGKSLEGLMSAYQSGARLAWRHMATITVRHELPAVGVALLADAVFAFVDQLCAASTRGYVAEQWASSSEREQARRELAEMLLSDRSDDRMVEATAQRASWALPSTAAVVLIPDEPVAHDLLSHLGPSTLPVRRPDAVGAIVPDPAGPGQRNRLADILHGGQAVVGPSVPLDRLPAALRITQVTARLRHEGALRADPLFVDEHLDAVIVRRDARLLEALQAQVLAPLEALPTESRNRLLETLAAWLTHLGDGPAVAAELHVHRQTVRYRLGRLRELFGPDLDDPAFRRKLLLAVGWQPADRENAASAPPPAQRRKPSSGGGTAPTVRKKSRGSRS
jgi:hypothetical protein